MKPAVVLYPVDTVSVPDFLNLGMYGNQTLSIQCLVSDKPTTHMMPMALTIVLIRTSGN